MLAVLILNRLNKLREARKQKSPAEKKPALEEIMYCRTCLGTDDLVSIFFNKDDETKKSEDLRLVTGLEVSFFICFNIGG